MTFDKRRDLLTFHNEHPKDDMKFLEQTYDELKTLATNKAARRAFNLQRNHALKYSTRVELLDKLKLLTETSLLLLACVYGADFLALASKMRPLIARFFMKRTTLLFRTINRLISR